MRTLIISDIHANLTALEAVLADAQPFERVFCLGDMVGYGPDPNACIDLIRELPLLVCVKGNHDAATLGEIDVRTFNYEARASLAWVEGELSLDNRHWLGSLPERIAIENLTIVHGSPRNPIWEYVMDRSTAQANLQAFETSVCLVGHTHLPGIYQQDSVVAETPQLKLLTPGGLYSIEPKAIVNPGSVGQPRDHDARASYIIYDDEAECWAFRRVSYDVQQVQKRIRAAGLPERHAQRLEGGW